MSKLQPPFQGASPGWAIPRVETISANRTRGPWVGEWLLSRRDRLIVARYEVPGYRCRELRPGGTVEVIVSPRDICPRNRVHAALETPGILLKGMLTSNLSRDPFNRPAGTGLFPHDSRHFVPGYYRALPPGQSHSPIETPRIILAPIGLKPWAESCNPVGANSLT
jgi:hypothetical protein